ncbi:unnamed protein product [Darwinula stevensoni]|uniref:Uncharacterized protein n=1 Tax=Darwinula stevensoni TaxID=69355 RepID=A0A7R8WZZ5_9CRUS|nr:unnamed protein product [Darwinula stevensoni]CAG0880677.1 unnamed protein product [Darwinula stevensoni]
MRITETDEAEKSSGREEEEKDEKEYEDDEKDDAREDAKEDEKEDDGIEKDSPPSPPSDATKPKQCRDCDTRHASDPHTCPLYNPHLRILDTELPDPSVFPRDKDGLCYAEASLPKALRLQKLGEGEGVLHTVCVLAGTKLRKFTQLGPLLGERIQEADIREDFLMKHLWERRFDTSSSVRAFSTPTHIPPYPLPRPTPPQVFAETGKFYVSTGDPNKSNWVRYVRPAMTRSGKNLLGVVRDQELFFLTTKDIGEGEELRYWIEDPNSTPLKKKKLDKACKLRGSACGGCGMTFTYPLYYRLHISVFHDPEQPLNIRKYYCKVCGVAVLGKDNIMKHAAEMHHGRGAYQCQFCKKFFLRLSYLDIHRNYGCKENPQRTRPLCDFCGRKFCQPQKLKVHIKRMHSDMTEVLREFQCKHCLKLLGSRAALQRHMKEVHQRSLSIGVSCEQCGKTFQNKSNLKIHMLTHSGIKPFKCEAPSCESGFTTKQCLQFHYRKSHGYTEENMPPINRLIPYTFDAYSGGKIVDPARGKLPDQAAEDSTSKPSSTIDDYIAEYSEGAKLLTKASRKWVGEQEDPEDEDGDDEEDEEEEEEDETQNAASDVYAFNDEGARKDWQPEDEKKQTESENEPSSPCHPSSTAPGMESSSPRARAPSPIENQIPNQRNEAVTSTTQLSDENCTPESNPSPQMTSSQAEAQNLSVTSTQPSLANDNDQERVEELQRAQSQDPVNSAPLTPLNGLDMSYKVAEYHQDHEQAQHQQYQHREQTYHETRAVEMHHQIERKEMSLQSTDPQTSLAFSMDPRNFGGSDGTRGNTAATMSYPSYEEMPARPLSVQPTGSMTPTFQGMHATSTGYHHTFPRSDLPLHRYSEMARNGAASTYDLDSRPASHSMDLSTNRELPRPHSNFSYAHHADMLRHPSAYRLDSFGHSPHRSMDLSLSRDQGQYLHDTGRSNPMFGYHTSEAAAASRVMSPYTRGSHVGEMMSAHALTSHLDHVTRMTNQMAAPPPSPYQSYPVPPASPYHRAAPPAGNPPPASSTAYHHYSGYY